MLATPYQIIDSARLDRVIGDANFVLIRVPRRTRVEEYINTKMQALRREEEMKRSYPHLFVGQNNDAPYEEKVLFINDALYFDVGKIADYIGREYRKIFLFTSIPRGGGNVLEQGLVAAGCLVLDAFVYPDIPTVVC